MKRQEACTGTHGGNKTNKETKKQSKLNVPRWSYGVVERLYTKRAELRRRKKQRMRCESSVGWTIKEEPSGPLLLLLLLSFFDVTKDGEKRGRTPGDNGTLAQHMQTFSKVSENGKQHRTDGFTSQEKRHNPGKDEKIERERGENQSPTTGPVFSCAYNT